MNRKNRRKITFANKLHKQIFLTVFLTALLSAVLVSVCLYYLIFGVTAEQLGFPEAIAYHIIPASQKVTVILLLAAPASILIMMFFAYKISHRIVGPFDRIVRELDECIKGNKKDHIPIRESDKFRPLVDRINSLLDRLNS